MFVGAGPGAPDLITVAGRKALEEADLIVAAGSLVNPEIMACRKPDCLVVDSAPMNLAEIVKTMVDGQRAGKKVVRLHTGDPSLYGAIHEQFVLLKTAGVPHRVIPGVTAAMAAAASLGLEFTLPEITQTLIMTRMAGRTPVPSGEELASLASHRASMALYLSAAQAGEVGKVLGEAYGPDAPLAVCIRVSWPDARTLWTTPGELAGTLAKAGADRHALIVVGPAVATLRNGVDAPKSKLYDPRFGHAHRPKQKK
ncbi:MAG: precorrin-4 C(11)-methyltransferase [Deltaproteobacteria bacterium]|nr:precorrin-4 C(11)-methyltransferase [Deltaproteobacteria bacterium]